MSLFTRVSIVAHLLPRTILIIDRIYSRTSGSPYRGSSFQDIASTRLYGGGGVTSGLTGLVAGTTRLVPFRSSECR